MLTKFLVSNYFSFKETAQLELDVPWSRAKIYNQNVLLDYKKENKKRGILNSAMIYGANASGKTNLIVVLKFLKYFVANGHKFENEEQLEMRPVPFKFANDSKSIKIEIECVDRLDKQEYFMNYQLSLDGKTYQIEKERLSYALLSKAKRHNFSVIFERQDQEIKTAVKTLDNIIEKVIKDNIDHKALLSLIINTINKSVYKNETTKLDYRIANLFYKNITEKIIFSGDNRENIKLVAEQIIHDDDFKNNLLASLTDFDFSISDFQITDVTQVTRQNAIESIGDIPDEVKKEFLAKFMNEKIYNIQTIHKVANKNYPLDFSYESQGTTNFINQFLAIYDAIKNGKLYVSDEFENAYHPRIQQAIINKLMFDGKESQAQFIFTTHNTDFLKLSIFAKEQIYFVSKNRDTQASELYALSEFPEVTYNNHNWKNLYMEGRLGSVPEVLD